MKKIFFTLVALCSLISCGQTEKTNFESGILWQIESEDGLVSYIFGTIHLYPKSEMELPEKALLNLQKCNVLALERNVTKESENQKFAAFKMPDIFLESYRIIVAEYRDDLISMEGELVKKAIEWNLTLTGLETTDESLDALRAVTNLKIDETIFNKEQILEYYKSSVRRYKNESIGEYYESSNAEMGEEITRILVDQRNNNWIENIEFLIQRDKTFIAVGVGHLGGKNGILNLLSEKGYLIKKVE